VVAETLGVCNQKDAIPVFEILLEDANGFVRMRAAKSLASLETKAGLVFLRGRRDQRRPGNCACARPKVLARLRMKRWAPLFDVDERRG